MELYNIDENYEKAISHWYNNKGHLQLIAVAALFNLNYNRLTIMMKNKIIKDYKVKIPEDKKVYKITSSLNSIDALVNSQKFAVGHSLELYEYLLNNSKETILKNYHVQRSRNL